MSIAEYPAVSSSRATGVTIPVRSRIPHRHCWPSRKVWSTRSMCVTAAVPS